MRKQFAITANVKRYLAAVNTLLASPPGVDKFMLVYGHVGLGKTESSIWWKNTQCPDAVFIRIKKAMTTAWLLQELVAELGLPPQSRTSDLFHQVVGELLGSNRPLILDEIDYVAGKTVLIETLRDIGDMAGTPVVLIGMPEAPGVFSRFPALQRRISQVVQFDGLHLEDVRAVLDQICEVPVADCAAKAIHGAGKLTTVAQLYRWAQTCEILHRSKKLAPEQPVTAELLQRKG